jgi:hypothetical protein
LTTLPADGTIPPATLASWEEKALPGPPRGWATRPEQLWDDGKDLPGARLMVPWQTASRIWFPRQDRLWVSSGALWTLWERHGGFWQRAQSGLGLLTAQPPLAMGLTVTSRKPEETTRKTSPPDRAEWTAVPVNALPWPPYDPAWAWWNPDLAATAWDQRWGRPAKDPPPERQREALLRSFRPEWRESYGLRASVRGWIPDGPEVALREAEGVAWIWVGDRVIQVRLQPTERLKHVRKALKVS